MATTIVTKNGSGAPTASDLVAGELAVDLTNGRLYTTDLDSGGTVLELGTNPASDVTFGDNTKAIFGAGSDLQIFHDASDSIINDNGTGSLKLQQGGSTKLEVTATGIDVTGTALAHEIEIGDGSAGGTSEILFSDNVSARGKILYDHSSNPETMLLQTTGTTAISIDNSQNVSMPNGNLDVTGSVTADGLTVDVNSGDVKFIDTGTAASDTPQILIGNGDTSARSGLIRNYNDATNFEIIASASTTSDKNLVFRTVDNASESRLKIANNGDISFYEDTGTTAKLFWDASAESLGIGTASPVRNVSVLGSASATMSFQNSTTGSTLTDGLFIGNDASLAYLYNYEATPIVFATSATERMRIDSSGNVGINATTIAANGLQIGNTSSTDTEQLFLYSNKAIFSINTDGATNAAGTTIAYSWANGGQGPLKFDNATSTVMTLDASGNLLVGLSSGQDALIHAQAPKATYTDFGTVFAGGTDSHNGKHAISLMSTGDALAGIVGSNLYVDGTSYNQSTTARSSGYISFSNGTTAGKTSTITFGGLVKGTATALPKMTLDGDGNLLVGTTTSAGGGKLTVDVGAISGTLVSFQNSQNLGGSITVVSGGGTAYNTSSDQRLKENIADADDAGGKIDAIQVRKYDWKADGSHQDYGMIAQELQVVAPEAVSGDPDSEEMMGVDYSKLVPMMLKEIQSLRARVAQLES
jgi:hypothetical protein